jgi:parvulin-like peptidyl-prolyl isomerase
MMKKFYLCFFALGLGVFLIAPLRAEHVDGIAAVVNDGVITSSQLYERLKCFSSRENGGDIPVSLKTEELNTLIEERLISEKALELGVSASEKEVKNELEEMKSSFASEEAYIEFLKVNNLTEKIVIEKIKTRELLGKIAEKEIMPGISLPSSSEARTFYGENADLFKKPRRVRLSRIVIEAGGALTARQAEEKIKEIKEKLSKGADFSGLAKEFSDGPEAAGGGDLGFVEEGELVPEIESEVFPLAPGETTGIFKTEEGFSILKITGADEGGQAEFEEVEHDIIKYLFQMRMEDAVNVWLEKIKSEAYIEVRI